MAHGNPETMDPVSLQLYNTHPNLGVGLCVDLPMSVESFHCILFHHEFDNGLGYPSGVTAESIPAYVKVLRICNAYDDLTRTKEWRRAETPFRALERLKNRVNFYHEDYIKRLILILAGAEVLDQEDPRLAKKSVNTIYSKL